MTTSASEDTRLTPDDIFEILSNHRRRMVLYYLRQNGGSAAVKELAEEVAAMENGTRVGELTSQQRKRVYVSLYQTHLPKMAQMNAIDYDKEGGTVGLTDQTDDIERYLNDEQGETYPWRLHYVTLTAVSGSVLGLSLLDVSVFAAVTALQIGVAALLAYAGSTAIQWSGRSGGETARLGPWQRD